MNIIAIFLNIIGFIFLLNTSKKAILNSSFLEKWMQQNNFISKIIGSIFLLISFYISIKTNGTTAGILFNLLAITLAGSLLILINPLKKIFYTSVLIILIIITALEFLIQ
ncbi:conserved membrane hypothetical protein [Tenacibaculum dicentrarchi]|uniref:DUF3325 domain-containing protein n=1 Tax=Tenacibaculum dicentrarchi TaxID=669041 RepID=A0ABM9NQL1_9FLAO|nr:conserved membrane hypothetical protein [Tenacibaculum dicentrarchi]SOS51867.1 conserved membrane hypothetical protein [Tenacibaculum dicentrarchi]SOU85719.1 conserved membrane hypothetical protein [Tenacibaculum dicentrarchi]